MLQGIFLGVRTVKFDVGQLHSSNKQAPFCHMRTGTSVLLQRLNTYMEDGDNTMIDFGLLFAASRLPAEHTLTTPTSSGA